MRPSSYDPQSHQQITPTTTTDTKTATVPAGCSAVMIGVGTTDARITFDGTTPSSTNGLTFPKDVAPVLVPVAEGAGIKAVSTASANAVVDLFYLA